MRNALKVTHVRSLSNCRNRDATNVWLACVFLVTLRCDQMKFLRPLVGLSGLIILLIVAFVWWSLPNKVDLADYAPADALVYLEVNSLPEITNALQQTDAWKAANSVAGVAATQPQANWKLFATRAGLGPAAAVITARSQIALVMLGVDTAEKDDFLRVKPEVAAIVETHTSKWRMKGTATSLVKRLADSAYGSSTCTERTAEADFVECVEPGGQRQVVGAIDGSLLIIGNSTKAVQSCLQVRLGQRPSLKTDPELELTRRPLSASTALAFGYISQRNASRLFSMGTPLLLGRTENDGQLQKLLGTSAEKLLRSIAWTSRATSGLIEDTYQISLDEAIVKRLGPAFETGSTNDDFWKFVPSAFRSVTVYQTRDPQAALQALDSAMALKLDAVSAVVMSALLKSGLSGYGVEDPKTLTATLSPPLLTLRPMIGESSLLISRIGNRDRLKQVLGADFLAKGNGQVLEGPNSEPANEKEFTALLLDDFLVIGKTENIKIYLAQIRNQEMVTPEQLQNLNRSSRSQSAVAITYTNERATLTGLISAVSAIYGKSLSPKELEEVERALGNFNIATTESSLAPYGIERRSRSAFGLFGSLISLGQPDNSSK